MKASRCLGIIGVCGVFLAGCGNSVTGTINYSANVSDIYVDVEGGGELTIKGNSSSSVSESGVGSIDISVSDIASSDGTTLFSEYDNNYVESEDGDDVTSEVADSVNDEEDEQDDEETEVEELNYTTASTQSSENILHTLFGYSSEIKTTSNLSNLTTKTGLPILAPDLGEGRFVDYTYIDGTAVIRYEVSDMVMFFVTSQDADFDYTTVTKMEFTDTNEYGGQGVSVLYNNVYDALYFEIDETQYMILVYNGDDYDSVIESAIDNL